MKYWNGMAKDKKRVKDFQQALQQNLQGMREEGSASSPPPSSRPPDLVNVRIRRELMEKYHKLAQQHQLDQQQFIEVALNFFLSLEETWFGEKMTDE
jgi:hypothetical protein